MLIRTQDLTFGKELGRGRFSIVYAGRLKEGARSFPVAIKKFPPHIGECDFKQFQREAEAMLVLRHKSINELYGIHQGIVW